MTIGERIKELRKEKGLTQKDLAERVGFSYVNISQLENSRKNPKLETIRKIAAALDVSMNELLDENWSMFTPQDYAEDMQATITKFVQEPGDWVRRAKTKEGIITLPPDYDEFERYLEKNGFKIELDSKGQFWLTGKTGRAILTVADLMNLVRSSRATVTALAQSVLDKEAEVPNQTGPIVLHDVKAESEAPKGFRSIPTPQVDTFAAHVNAGQPQPTKEQIDAAEALADELRRKSSTP